MLLKLQKVLVLTLYCIWVLFSVLQNRSTECFPGTTPPQLFGRLETYWLAKKLSSMGKSFPSQSSKCFHLGSYKNEKRKLNETGSQTVFLSSIFLNLHHFFLLQGFPQNVSSDFFPVDKTAVWSYPQAVVHMIHTVQLLSILLWIITISWWRLRITHQADHVKKIKQWPDSPGPSRA